MKLLFPLLCSILLLSCVGSGSVSYDKTDTPRQIFASMQQQAREAGIPYDLLGESDLTDAPLLASYDALILPAITNVKAVDRAAMVAALAHARAAGTGLVTAGDFMIADENGQSFDDSALALQELIGLKPMSFITGQPARFEIINNQHPVTRHYTVSEQLDNYSALWFADMQPAAGVDVTTLATLVVGDTSHGAVMAVDNGARALYFSSIQIMTDNNLLSYGLEWLVYGQESPAALQLSRSDGLFVARNDMDQTMYPNLLASIHEPLLDIHKAWKRDFNFNGSYYIDIGNDPAQGKYTDWSVSRPLMSQYLDTGAEIGTHSWTHPYFTAELSDPELEFEFNQSKKEIATQLGINVTGGAIPGNSESLQVVANLNQWFDYFSGRATPYGMGNPAAIGKLHPNDNMIYLSLNMSPDYTLSDYLGLSPEASEQVWREEFESIGLHAQQPVFHWLWHDYAPTTESATGKYSVEMFTNTVQLAHNQGVEFVTADDLQKRVRSLANAQLSVGVDQAIEATVTGSGLGRFALKLPQGARIHSVDNWYAWNEQRVFLPKDGGQFTINTGDAADPVTRISNLPMRARLDNVTGDGNELSFSLFGEGEVQIVLSQTMINQNQVVGADTVVESDGVLTLGFLSNTSHSVTVVAVGE